MGPLLLFGSQGLPFLEQFGLEWPQHWRQVWTDADVVHACLLLMFKSCHCVIFVFVIHETSLHRIAMYCSVFSILTYIIFLITLYAVMHVIILYKADSNNDIRDMRFVAFYRGFVMPVLPICFRQLPLLSSASQVTLTNANWIASDKIKWAYYLHIYIKVNNILFTNVHLKM